MHFAASGRGANLFSVTVMRKYVQNVKFTFLHGIKLKLLIWNYIWKMNWFYALLSCHGKEIRCRAPALLHRKFGPPTSWLPPLQTGSVRPFSITNQVHVLVRLWFVQVRVQVHVLDHSFTIFHRLGPRPRCCCACRNIGQGLAKGLPKHTEEL